MKQINVARNGGAAAVSECGGKAAAFPRRSKAAARAGFAGAIQSGGFATALRNLFLLVLTACVSVDPGLDDVHRTVAARANADLKSADDAVAMAVANNPRLQATLAELGIARADLLEASTIRNPIFEAEIRFPGDPHRPYELRLAQTFVDLLQLRRRRAAGRMAFDAAKLRVTSEVLRFGADVRAHYFDVVAKTQHVAMSRANFEAAQEATDLAQRQHAAQNITDLDLETQQAAYEEAKLELARAEQQLLLARELLVRDLNATEWKLDESFPALPQTEPDAPQLEQLAATRRLDLELARREVDLAKRRVPIARLAALGDIEADVHYEREPSGERTFGPGVLVPVPLFNTGEAARSRAEAQWMRARHTLDALLAESASRLRTARATVAEARARVEYYRDVVLPRRKRIVELTQLEQNAMVAGIDQVLQARQHEAQAQRDFIDAQRDYWIAKNDLERVVNGIGGE